MKKFLGILILFILLTACSSSEKQEQPGSYLKAEGKRIVDAEGNNVILKGIGLGGYMLQEGYMLKVPFSGQQYVIRENIEELIGEAKTEEFYNKWKNNFIQKADIDSLKAWGFNSVRLPMHYNLYTLPVDQEPQKGKNTWLDEGFVMTDSLVSWCKANDMYLILDMHAAPGGQGHDVNISDRDPSKPSLWESEENQDKLVELWKKLAERYKDEPTIGAYDLINEPNWSFEGYTEDIAKNGVFDTLNKPLKDLMVRLTDAVRSVDKNHIIVIEGNGWGNNYKGMLPPWDDNLVLSFHKYWNYNNQEAIQPYLDFREKYNIPIWLGESGENSNAWFTDAISLMEKNNIGWCWWPLKKLGPNNPVQIKINEGYQEILDYWRGTGPKPSEEEASSALMQLAENTKIENCIIRNGVIDAMMRQPSSEETLPYTEVQVPEDTIKAVNYDLGNNQLAYMDKDIANYYVSTGGERERWNKGNSYRNDGVDIYGEEDQFYVGDIQKDEWLKYTFTAASEGTYDIGFKISSKTDTGKVEILINDEPEGKLVVPVTSGSWEWIWLPKVKLDKGENHLIFKIEEGGFNFRSIKFNKADTI